MKIHEFVYYDKMEDLILMITVGAAGKYKDDKEFIYLGKL